MIRSFTINKKKRTSLRLITCQLGGKEGEFTASLLHNFLFRPSISVEFQTHKQTYDGFMYKGHDREMKQHKTDHFLQASTVHQEACKMYSQFATAVCGGGCALAPTYDIASEYFSLFVLHLN
jgi:hypothetical protein